jgi:iron complex outermembrane receptor protein
VVIIPNQRFYRKTPTCWLLAGSICGLGSGPVLAAAPVVGIEEVVVTARKREESLQAVPLAVSSLDSNAIENMGLSNVADLAEKVPMISMAPFPNTSSAMVVFMRGVGTIDSEQIARDSGVGIYLDDVYLGRAQGLTTDLIDIERIEVLRGPQGTLYGRNTIGGAIKFVTAKPTGEWGFSEDISIGNRDYRRSLTTLNLPRYADFSVALSYLDAARDGTVKNPADGPDFDQKNKRGYRVALRWQPLPELTADYSYDHSLQHGTSMYEQRGGPGYFPTIPVPISPHRLGTAIRPVTLPIEDDFTTSGHALTVAWDISDALTIKSITSYRKLDADSLHDTVEAFGIPAAFISDTEQDQFSQELLLNGDIDDAHLKYIVGAFYFRERADQETAALANPFLLAGPPTLDDFAAEPDAHVENSSAAVYGQLTWTPQILENRLNLSLGARESRDKREIERTELGAIYDQDDKSFSSFDPSFTADYGWSEDLHTYASYSEGYRTGGFNLRSPANSPPFDPEELTTYEIGIKSSWAQRVRANAALYHSKYRDIQIDFIDPLTNMVNTVNGSEATIKGLELEVTAVPIERWEITADYAYMDAQQKGDVIDPQTQLPLQGISMPFTPHNKYNLSTTYTLPPFTFGSLSGRVGYSWNDEQTSNGGPNTDKDRRPSFGLLDARIALSQIPLDRYGNLTIAVWGKNLEDKEYVVYRLYGADIYGEPRSYGIDLNYKL